MKIIPCLNVYNEAEFLPHCIDALLERGLRHIQVVDGRYRGYPGTSQHSDDGTWEWLALNAEAKGLTVAGPPEGGWPGQEVKRTKYLRMADRIATDGDWLLQVDADEFLVDDVADDRGRRLRDYLAELNAEPESPTRAQLVYVMMRNVYPDRPPSFFGEYPKVIRWRPGLYYGREHWDVMKPDGQRLWNLALQLDAQDIRIWPHFHLEHHTYGRPEWRKQQKSEYEEFRIVERRLHGAMNPNPTAEV